MKLIYFTATLLLISCFSCYAATKSVDIEFVVTMDEPASHIYHVELKCHKHGTGTYPVFLPADRNQHQAKNNVSKSLQNILVRWTIFALVKSRCEKV